MTRRTTRRYRALNALLRPTLRSRQDPGQAWAKAVGMAEEATGVAVTYIDQTWIGEYQFLLECVAAEPRLSAVGWQAILGEATSRLANRLRIRDFHHRDRAIGREPITEPIFVVGLPRTATTLAHHLLAGAPQCRGPLAWEMTHTDLNPDQATIDRRLAAARRQYRVTQWAPDIDVVHPIDVRKPEESLMALPHGLYRCITYAPMSRYRDWFGDRDPTPDYQYLKALLQVLQHGRQQRRWVLKYPLDVGQMPTIRKVFPDATFVWTHRDPVTVMGSLCSLADLLQSLYLTRTDPTLIGEFTLNLMADTINAGREFRQHHRSAVIDVPYHRLVADPIRYVPELHHQLGLEWTLDDGERLVRALQRSDRRRDRKHEYSLGTFGLDPDRVSRAFGDYQKWIATINN